jgi:hypothetical protein
MPFESENFIYATCRRAGFSTRSFIQNTPRDHGLGSDNAKPLLLMWLRDGTLTGLHS